METQKKEGEYSISSPNSELNSFVKSVNSYLKQGKKSIKEVLSNASAEYQNMGSNETEAVMDIEMEDEFKNNIKKYEKTQEQIELEKIKDKFKNFTDKNANKTAVDRLLKDYQLLSTCDLTKQGFTAEPKNGNLFLWEVRLWNFDKSICKAFNDDLKKYGQKHAGQDYVKLEMRFPPEYPYLPPFIRVVAPRFVFHTGRVTVGGSICFELLTASGWFSTLSIESIFLQIKLEMTNGNPAVDWGNESEYTENEAKEAFFRVANDHGWSTQGLK